MTIAKPIVDLYLAAPRGFCAGVYRAIKIVEMALIQWGSPVYVRHEIVHNAFVVENLRQRGAIFVESLDECRDNRPVIFSAHGVAQSVIEKARRREMIYVDATCPLVSKVHNEAIRYAAQGYQIIMIGHADHPEVIGTMGQLPVGIVLLVENISDVTALKPQNLDKLAYITQTTLSIDDTAMIISALQKRFPKIQSPRKQDICYATTNRQAAVKALVARVEALLVIGANNSSNSQRLVEVGKQAGCGYCCLIGSASDIRWDDLAGMRSLGLTAGASAPEILVKDVIKAFRSRYDVRIEIIKTAVEHVEFKVPPILRHKGNKIREIQW